MWILYLFLIKEKVAIISSTGLSLAEKVPFIPASDTSNLQWSP